jgi:hypothetical protein
MEIISKFLSFLLAAPVIFLLVRYSLMHSRKARVILLFSHAFVLTILTIFLFNKPFWNWSNQTGLIQNVPSHEENQEAYKYIRDNFILVDNSFDKELILNPEGDEDDSTTIVLTNRRKLAQFLQLLNANLHHVDLVVGDIGFDLATADDTLLQQEFLKLSAENKLLLSIVPGNKNVLALRENVYGHVVEEGSEKLFVSHTIKQGAYYSLPYKLYCYLNGLHADEPFLFESLLKENDTAASETNTVSNTFFPDFFITDEEHLKGRISPGNNPVSLDMEEGVESGDHTFYYLSEPLSQSGTVEFANNLKQRKQKGQKNIIFLGTFSSPTEDVHQTIYTDLHGSTIILNIFYALQLQRHHLTFLFILILFIGYSAISWVLIYRSLKINMFSKGQKAFAKKHFTWFNKPYAAWEIRMEKKFGKLKEYKAVKMVINIIDFLIEFLFVEELHLVLLIVLIFVVKNTTGQMINGMSLLIYLAVINALLRYAKAHMAADREVSPAKK